MSVFESDNGRRERCLTYSKVVWTVLAMSGTSHLVQTLTLIFLRRTLSFLLLSDAEVKVKAAST